MDPKITICFLVSLLLHQLKLKSLLKIHHLKLLRKIISTLDNLFIYNSSLNAKTIQCLKVVNARQSYNLSSDLLILGHVS